MNNQLFIEAGLILGLLVVLLLFFFRKKSSNSNNIILAISVFCSWYCLLVNNLNASQQIIHYPYLIRTGNFFVYLIFPFLYIYTRNTFYPTSSLFRKYDWLFLVPAGIYLVDLLPFFLSNPEYKIAVMKANLQNPKRMYKVAEGWIGINGFHFVFRYIWSVFVMILQFSLLWRNRKMDIDKNGGINRTLFWFIIIITTLHLPLFIPSIFGVLFHLKWYSLQYLNSNLSLVLITTSIFVLFSPHILYGFLPMPVNANDNQTIADTRQNIHIPHKLFIAEKETEAVVATIVDCVISKKAYLDPRYTIHDLARDTGVPVYQLSPIINNHYNTNFNAWLNKYRVNHFEQLCQQPENNELTIDALAKESGFSNRTTLTAAFKKEKNITPGLYLKQLKNNSTASFS